MGLPGASLEQPSRKRRAVVQASTRKPKIVFQLLLGRLPCQRRAIVQATAGTKLKLHLKKRCSRSDWTSASRPNVQQVVFHTCHASATRTAPDQTASGQAVELRLDVPVHTKRRTSFASSWPNQLRQDRFRLDSRGPDFRLQTISLADKLLLSTLAAYLA